MTTARRTSDALVRLDDVCFAYEGVDGRPLTALEHVSFRVERGEMVTLTGPNGCGKSTAMRIMNGLAFADEGTCRFDGDVVDARSMADPAFAKRLHQRMGFVFQDSDVQLFCPSVREEVAFGPRQMGLAGDELSRRVGDALDVLGISGLADRAPYHLSGGEKKKVALACVVSMNPDLLVLDEPTDGLDEGSAEAVAGFLRAFVAAGKSVLASTHHRDLVEALGARDVRMGGDHRVVGG